MISENCVSRDETAAEHDLALLRLLERKRQNGELRDTDRVSLFGPDDTVRLYSAFGHRASDETFVGICRANFIALNPERGES